MFLSILKKYSVPKLLIILKILGKKNQQFGLERDKKKERKIFFQRRLFCGMGNFSFGEKENKHKPRPTPDVRTRQDKISASDGINVDIKIRSTLAKK